MNFGQAIEAMQHGAKVARNGWNGKGMWIKIKFYDPCDRMSAPFVYMKTADGAFVPWTASQSDMLSSDWVEV